MKRLSSTRKLESGIGNPKLEESFKSLEQVRLFAEPVIDKLAKASATFHNGCVSMRYAGADMIYQGELMSQIPDYQFIGNLFIRIGKQMKQAHELMDSMSQNISNNIGESLQKMLNDEHQELQNTKKAFEKQYSKISGGKRRSQLNLSASKIEELEREQVFLKKLEKSTSVTVANIDMNWTKQIGNALIAASNAFYEMFQNGEKTFRTVYEENEEIVTALNEKLQEKEHQSSGKPQMFRRCESPGPRSGTRQFSIGESRMRSSLSPVLSPRSAKNEQLSRRRSMRFEIKSMRVGSDLGVEKSPRTRPLSYHLRVSSPDLKSAMLQPIQPPSRTIWDKPKSATKSEEEIATERELAHCNDDAYAILLKLILRESYYRKRLSLVIENFMIPLTFDPWRGRIKPEEFKDIFRNIILLRDVHLTIAEQLEECKTEWEKHGTHSLVLLLANIVEKLGVYEEYVSAAPEAAVALDNCIKRSRNLHSFIQSCQKGDAAEESLVDLLGYPEHVISSYKSTLELLMVTQVNTDDQELFERSFHLLAKYQKEIESNIEEKRQKALVEGVQTKIQGHVFSDEPNRVFLCQSGATVTIETAFGGEESTTKVKMTLFLFNDILVLTKRNKQRLNSIREGQAFKFMREIKLYRTRIDSKSKSDSENSVMLIEREHADHEIQFIFQFKGDKAKEFKNFLSQAFEFIDSRKVYGIPLDTLMKTKREEGKLIPTIVELTVKELLKKTAQRTEGLFRVSGNASTILSFLNHVNQGGKICLTALDVHTIAGLLKLFFRSMPEPIMTYKRYEAFLAVTDIRSSAEKILKYKKLIGELSDCAQFTLQHAFSFFFLLASYQDINKMTESNIAIVMAPILLHSEVNDLAAASRQSTACEVIADLITYYKEIFTDISIRRKALEAEIF